MIVDASAIVAIIKGEAETPVFAAAMESAEAIRVSAATYFESAIVIDGVRNPKLSARFDELMGISKLEIEPVTAEQAKMARQAYRDYGRGSGHAANLNYGDCFSYALAREKREPILFKGTDFAATDLRPAVPRS